MRLLLMRHTHHYSFVKIWLELKSIRRVSERESRANIPNVNLILITPCLKMTCPTSERATLRAFVRATEVASTHLAYVPPSDSPLAPSFWSEGATTLPRSAQERPRPLGRSSSFANLLRAFRSTSAPATAPATTLPTSFSAPADLSRIRSMSIDRFPTISSDTLEVSLAIPQRSSSLQWSRESTYREFEDVVVVDADQKCGERNVGDALQLEIAAELQDTFREWEQRFGLSPGKDTSHTSREHPSVSLQSLELMTLATYTSTPLTPFSTQLLTPGPLYLMDEPLSPLRSQFSCDSDDEERLTVLEVLRNAKPPSTPGSIGRLTRKMSNAIQLGLVRGSPLGHKWGLGKRRDTT